jgi:hypothetical protein
MLPSITVNYLEFVSQIFSAEKQEEEKPPKKSEVNCMEDLNLFVLFLAGFVNSFFCFKGLNRLFKRRFCKDYQSYTNYQTCFGIFVILDFQQLLLRMRQFKVNFNFIPYFATDIIK